MKNLDVSLDKYALVINSRVFSRPLYVMSVSRSVLPPTSCIAEHIEGRAGAVFKRQDIMPRELVVTCLVLASTKQEAHSYIRNVLAPALISDRPLALEFPTYYPGMTFYGVLSGDTEIKQQGSGVEIELTFSCPDPFMYGKKQRVNTADQPDASHIEVMNQGSAPCRFIIEGIIQPAINMANSGATIHLSVAPSYKHLYVFSGSNIGITTGYTTPPLVWIDPYNHMMTLGEFRRDEYINSISDRVQLTPGINTFGGFEYFQHAHITYQERWY